jgi:hypothetical protein
MPKAFQPNYAAIGNMLWFVLMRRASAETLIKRLVTNKVDDAIGPVYDSVTVRSEPQKRYHRKEHIRAPPLCELSPQRSLEKTSCHVQWSTICETSVVEL